MSFHAPINLSEGSSPHLPKVGRGGVLCPKSATGRLENCSSLTPCCLPSEEKTRQVTKFAVTVQPNVREKLFNSKSCPVQECDNSSDSELSITGRIQSEAEFNI